MVQERRLGLLIKEMGIMRARVIILIPLLLVLLDCSATVQGQPVLNKDGDLRIENILVEPLLNKLRLSFDVRNISEKEIFVYDFPFYFSVLEFEESENDKKIEVWIAIPPIRYQKYVIGTGAFKIPEIISLKSKERKLYKMDMDLPISYRWMYEATKEELKIKDKNVYARLVFGYSFKPLDKEEIRGSPDMESWQKLYKSDWFQLDGVGKKKPRG